MDRKVLNHVMDRFEDEASRARAKEQMQALTSKNKDWSIQDRREEKEQRRREEQWRAKKEEDDRLRRKRREEREARRMERQREPDKNGQSAESEKVVDANKTSRAGKSSMTAESDKANLLKSPAEQPSRAENEDNTKSGVAAESHKSQKDSNSCCLPQISEGNDEKGRGFNSSSSGTDRQALFVRKCDGGVKKDTHATTSGKVFNDLLSSLTYVPVYAHALHLTLSLLMCVLYGRC